MKQIVLVLMLGALAAGCNPPPPGKTVIDTFCLTAKKRLWSIHDTPESIKSARAWNKGIDRKCGVPGRG